MTKSRGPLFVGAVLGGGLSVFNQPAISQDQQVAGGLEEIIVTARRREESLMDTPLSISSFTSDDLALRQVTQSYQIAEATPNLVYRNVSVGSNVAGLVFIRGIGQTESLPTLQPGVGTYVDGVYVASITGSVTDLVDTESITVLRGPQGTLFGRNTIGGAIQITSVKPHEELEGDLALEFGEFDYQSLKAMVNVPFTDNFYGRFSALRRQQDGYVETPLIVDDKGRPGDDTTAFRGALRWVPTDALTFDLTFDHSDRQNWGEPIILEAVFEEIGPVIQNRFAGSTPWQYNTIVAPALGLPLVGDQFAAPDGEYLSYATFFRKSENDISATTLTAEWDVSDNLTFKSISNYREQESLNGRDNDQSPAPVQHSVGFFDGWQRSQEFQLLGNALDGRLNWVAGLYHFEEDMINAPLVPFPVNRFISGAHVQNKSNAIFGQFTYDITDQLSLTVGVRNTDEKFDSVIDENIQYVTEWFCGDPNAPPPVVGRCAQEGPGFVGYVDFPPNSFQIIADGQVFESDVSRTEPMVNLAYRFTDNLMGYISYSEGFKGGGFTQRVPPGRPVISFGPEFAEVIEVGTKWTAWNDRLRLTAAAFMTDYEDIQVPASSLLGSIFVNAGTAEFNGGELELTMAATNRLTLSMGVGRLNTKYTSVNDIDVLGNPAFVDFDINDDIPNAPEWQTNASIMYRTPFLGGELIARLDHNYSDVYYTNAQNEPGTLVPSWSVFHGGLTYIDDSDRWEVALQARNLTDEYQVVDKLGNIFANGYIYRVVAPPRQANLKFSYRF